MADEEQKKEGQSKRSGKRSRRRYFRRNKKGKSGQSASGGQSGGDKTKGERNDQSRRSKSQRNRRRRRRSKSQSPAPSGPSIVQEIDSGYTPPESVFVYTHILRPDQRDNYTFRSEIAHGTGRTLDDFQIDLSLLFPEDAEAVIDGPVIEEVMDETPVDEELIDEVETTNELDRADDTLPKPLEE